MVFLEVLCMERMNYHIVWYIKRTQNNTNLKGQMLNFVNTYDMAQMLNYVKPPTKAGS